MNHITSVKKEILKEFEEKFLKLGNFKESEIDLLVRAAEKKLEFEKFLSSSLDKLLLAVVEENEGIKEECDKCDRNTTGNEALSASSVKIKEALKDNT